MKYAKIENNIVVQIQPYEEDGFVQVADNVKAQMEQKSDNTFDYPQSHYDAIATAEAEATTKATNRTNAITKLKASTWSPLTDDEATALFGE